MTWSQHHTESVFVVCLTIVLLALMASFMTCVALRERAAEHAPAAAPAAAERVR